MPQSADLIPLFLLLKNKNWVPVGRQHAIEGHFYYLIGTEHPLNIYFNLLNICYKICQITSDCLITMCFYWDNKSAIHFVGYLKCFIFLLWRWLKPP